MSSPPPSRSPNRHLFVDRCSSIRACEPCKRRKRLCNGQRPCTHCVEAQLDCVYSVVSDHSRSVFTTSTARRLSSGSACETCRRRKTKCDGGNPCAFCASAGIECINNSERRKRAMAVPVSAPENTDAMDRIEDRLRRIEKLMTAFTPSPLSQSTSFQDNGSERHSMDALTPRKLSSPRSPRSPSPSYGVRQHRHSIQGISGAKEQAELRAALAASRKGSESEVTAAAHYATPPNSNRSKRFDYASLSMSPPASSSSPPPPPLSPGLMMRPSSSATQPITSSMLNLSLSPSSSTSSNSSMLQPIVQPSCSVPASPPSQSTPVSSVSPAIPITTSPTTGHEHTWPASPPHSGSESSVQRSGLFKTRNHPTRSDEWKTSTAIPSLMDQLSRRTFATTALDYSMNYPIYPISHHTKEQPMPTPTETTLPPQ